MNLTVFGAAGRTGRQIVAQAVGRGHEVMAFVRDAGAFDPPPAVRVVQGDARDTAAVEGALRGADAAISVLALMSADAEPEYSDATRTIVRAAERLGVRRVVVAANNHAFGDAAVTGEFAAHAREHRRNRETLRASSLDWTIGAAPWVTDDPATGRYEAVLDAKAPGRRLPTGDLATFALDALQRDAWIGHLVGVSS
ncbi:MAG TPA: NAD(P)H-binding protein [Actinomycetota bacterium]|nr:NAD(P)H-binding protein [Actinomycetota bacterium]